MGKEQSTLTLLQVALWALLAFPGTPATKGTATHAAGFGSSDPQEQTTRSPHGPLAIPCENCHTAVAWRPIRAVPEFDHNKTQYPLRGMHEKVKCVECHVKPVFTNVGKNCADCHEDVHRRQMGPNCEQCHTVQGWNIAVQQVKDHQNRFPLLGAHAAVQCDECHTQAATGIFYGLSTQCDSCHLKDWQKTTNPPHASDPADFPAASCQGCHTTFDSWLGAVFTGNHAGPPINFPLTGGHAGVPCEQCHVGNNYHLQIAATDCGNSGCHLTTWQQTNNPTHSTAGPAFAVSNCSQCHDTLAWTDLTSFNHAVTGFTLTGMHISPVPTPCASCHVNNSYTLQIAPTDCGNSTCHLKEWNSTATLGGSIPNHITAGFPMAQCSTCHNTTSWATATFDHSTTGFPLTNAHASPPLTCAQCHVNGNYNLQIAPTDCGNSGCHLTDWTKTNNPTHATAGPSFAASNCSQCHDTIAWTDLTSFNHAVTGFTLTGQHVSPVPTPCASCHINNNYTLQIAPTDCGNSSCHLKDWNSTATLGGSIPNHITAGFPMAQCSTCHNTTSWATATFDHSTTGFPLTNSHASPPLTCAQCHINGNYNLQIAPTDCGNSGCHLTDWTNTNNPTHSTAGSAFAASNCTNCHDTIAWTDLTAFNHAVTGFTLTGMHISPTPTPCASCHVSNNYTLQIAPTDCGNSACHLKDWNSTTTLGGSVPNHVTAGFPIAQCSTCHNTTSWATATFDHSTTGFLLTNSHASPPLTCAQCHINGNYNLQIAPTDCGNSGCHLTDWTTTNNPTHSTAGSAFAASNCSQCHDTIAWTDLTSFNHAVTGFTLTGMHISPTPTPCVSCHVGNNYTLMIAPTDCGNSACHLKDWNSTTTLGGNIPNHVTAGFPIAQCSTCHNTTSWATSTFDHSTTGFALTGEHASPPLTCAQCHINGNYSLQIAPTDCANSGCHLNDWTTTTIPVHSAAGPTFAAANCANCHTTTALFTTTTWNHSSTGWTLTGNHQMAPAGAATDCVQCHVGNNYNLTVTDCYTSGCHTADWNSTVSLGGAVPNHVAAQFPTSLCSTCHDTLLWADGKFDHSTTGWALTGGHQMVPAAGGIITSCTQCHVSNNYSLTATNTVCYGCHVADWNSTATLGGAVPNHITANYPTTCDSCHTTTSWLGATFNHTYFPIPHHGSVCNDCHQVSTDYSSFTCINCHTTTAHQQTQTDNTHRGVGGYTYGPTTCYNCHKNGGGG